MTNNELKSEIIKLYDKKTIMRKPEGEKFYVCKIGTTKIGEEKKDAFQYSGQSKYVPFDTLFACYKKITSSGSLSRDWFNQNFPFESSSRPCNFTTIGSIFEILKIAKYEGEGSYRKVLL